MASKPKTIYVVDFDGTLFRGDLLAIYLIYHFLVYNDRLLLLRSVLSLHWSNSSELRKKIFTEIANRRDLAACFKRFAELQFLPWLYRAELFNFLTKKAVTDHVVVLTANYGSLVQASLQEKDASNRNQFFVIGTALPQSKGLHPPIKKGKEKVEAIEAFLREHELSREKINIHNFFDAYSDRFLVDVADRNVLISRSKKKRSFFSSTSECTDLENYLRVHAI